MRPPLSLLSYSSWMFAGIIFNGNINGCAPARCLPGLPDTLDMTVSGVGVVWLILVAMAFGSSCLISAKLKNQSATFGLGVSLVLTFSLLGFLRDDLKKMFWPLVDFNHVALSIYSSVFGGVKAYNVFGIPVSYGALAFVVCLALGAGAALLTYIAQKKRSVV